MRHLPLSRRSAGLFALAAAAVVSGTALSAHGDDAAPAPATSEVPRKSFKLTYKTKVPEAPAGTKLLEAWIPTPYADDLQAVKELTVTASVPYELTKDGVYGNRFVHVLVENPKGETTIDWVAVVDRDEDRGQGKAALLDAYLKSDSLASIDGRAKSLAESLGVTASKAPVADRARVIYDHVIQSMAYDKVEPGWGKGDFARACEIGKGNCSDFASKFITIARAAGIPSRWVSSISLAGEHMDCSACGYHCYAHFADGGRWIPVDPSDARRIVAKDPQKSAWFFGHNEANNIILSVGRDLVLAPKQQAGPVNFVAGPYVEVDGKPFDVPAKNRTYGHESADKTAAPAAPAAEAPAAPK